MSIGRVRIAKVIEKVARLEAVQQAIAGALNFKQVEHEIPRTASSVTRGVLYNPNVSTDIMAYVTPQGEDKDVLDYKAVFAGNYAYVAFTRSQMVANRFSGSLIPTVLKNASSGAIGLQIVCNPPVFNIDAEEVINTHLSEVTFVAHENDWVGQETHESEITGFHPESGVPVIDKHDIHYLQPTLGGIPVGLPYVNTEYKPRRYNFSLVSACDHQTQELNDKYKRQGKIAPDDQLLSPSEAVQIKAELRALDESTEAIDLSTLEGIEQYRHLPAPVTYRTHNEYFTRQQAQRFLDNARKAIASDLGFFSSPDHESLREKGVDEEGKPTYSVTVGSGNLNTL